MERMEREDDARGEVERERERERGDWEVRQGGPLSALFTVTAYYTIIVFYLL